VLFLLDARDTLEARELNAWVERTKPNGCSAKTLRIDDQAGVQALGKAITTPGEDDPWLQPLRIVWLPAHRGDDRFAMMWDLFFRWTQHPGFIRRRWLARKRRERMCITAGTGAKLSAVHRLLNETWGAVGHTSEDLPAFIERQAMVVLDRAERVTRGTRYKVPRRMAADVFASTWFRERLKTLADDDPAREAELLKEAEGYLREMAASQTPFTLDLTMSFARAMYRSTHDPNIDVIPEELEKVTSLLATRPVILLITHKSMLDAIALFQVLFENNLPLPLTFGGINLNTPGVGALARRAGAIFLRRTFGDNQVYTATFRRYVDYLMEKRFSLSWALEGARSRTGKLLPPRFGLFTYAVESILRTRLYDVAFLPVTIAYDQITEVEDYVIEQQGKEKTPEGIGWAVRFMREKLPLGRIFVRFGEPVNITDITDRDDLDRGLSDDETRATVQRLAFEVAVRMNAVTPLTHSSLVTLILLASGHRALTLARIKAPFDAGLALVERRGLEIVGPADPSAPSALKATLAALATTGVVTIFDGGLEPVYGIKDGAHLKAAYYRNTVIHHFLLDALAETALLAASQDVAETPIEVAEARFWAEMDALRELFKFEFYFPRRGDFADTVRPLLNDRLPGWQAALSAGASATRDRLAATTPLFGNGVLRSFVDAYRVVAEALVQHQDAITDRKAFLGECLQLGRQRQLEGRLFSEESVSKSLYETALSMAEYRGLVDAAAPEQRQDLLNTLRAITRRLDELLSLAGRDHHA
jgi:glycerol-3-phosphate O-acyltransferase